jgi:hypothetical protein
MRFLALTVFVAMLGAGAAEADHYRGRTVVRDHRGTTVYSGGSRVVVTTPYRGTIRADRHVVYRRPLYVNSGRFTFHNGHTVVYTRPTFTTRYYDVRVRPQVIVENYPAQHGYVWVNGSWGWSGNEWLWTGGHYAPDTSYNNYYDDGSYD